MASGRWEDIEVSESYLVSSMFEEAVGLSSTILRHLCNNNNNNNNNNSAEAHFDMMESAAMVLVQSLNQLNRTSEIATELKTLFGSATAIPVQVVLTGSCLQLSGGSASGVREFLEEFLSEWKYVDERYYVLPNAEANVACLEGPNPCSMLDVDRYLEVVEVYVVTLLSVVLDDLDIAISWVEKASLPEEKRQVLLRRLRSLYSVKASSSPADKHESLSYEKDLNISDVKPQIPCNGDNDTKQSHLQSHGRRRESTALWFRSLTLKFGEARLVISNGKVLLGCFIFLLFYVFRRKRASFTRIAMEKALSVKKALGDLWQLAFSYQVNPLAAVQSLPTATAHGTR